MLDPAVGWAKAGNEGVDDHILRTSDGGVTWRDVTPPEPQASAQQPLKSAAVYFLDADTAWATYYSRDLWSDEALIVWRTDNGGKSWEPSNELSSRGLSFSFPLINRPSYFHFADKQYGWLLVILERAMALQPVMLYRTTDGGESWERIYDPELSSLDGELDPCCKAGMDFASAETGLVTISPYAVEGAGRVAWTHDGGLTWQSQHLPDPNQVPMRGEFCTTFAPNLISPRIAAIAVECWLTEPDRIETFLYVTEDGGQTWRISPFPGGSLQFVSADVVWALDRTLHISRDGGRIWTIMDGDDATLCGDYEAALAFYQQAIFDEELLPWSSHLDPGPHTTADALVLDPIERANLSAYGRYRILLLHTAQGFLPEAQIVYDSLQDQFPEGLDGHAYAAMAAAFWEVFNEENDVGSGCFAAMEYATEHPSEILTPLGRDSYGFGVRDLLPTNVCPQNALIIES